MNKLVWSRIYWLGLLSFFLLQTEYISGQCMSYPVSLEERVTASNHILMGTLVEKISYFSEQDQRIYTSNIIEVKAWLKGHLSWNRVCVITEGGVLDSIACIVQPSLSIYPDFDYLFFVEEDEPVRFNPSLKGVSGMPQFFSYAGAQGGIVKQFGLYRDALSEPVRDEKGIFSRISSISGFEAKTPEGLPFEPRPYDGGSVAPRSISIGSFAPNPTNAGTVDPNDFLTITGTGFGATTGTIFYSNADNGGAGFVSGGAPSDYLNWSNTSITHKVLDEAGTGNFQVQPSSGGPFTSASPLNILYSHNSVYSSFGFGEITRQGVKLADINASGGYDILYNVNFDSNAAAKASFERALESWQCEIGVNFAPAGTTNIGTTARDDSNVIYFDSNLPSGTLGVAYSYFLGYSSGSTCVEWVLRDFDIAFRTTPGSGSWNFGPNPTSSGQTDFEAVALHELGHAIGLGHVIDINAIMHFSIQSGIDKRNLSASESSGGNDKMDFSSTLCATFNNPDFNITVYGPMTPLNPSTCALSADLVHFSVQRDPLVEDKVLLTWEVSELDNDRFIIESGHTATNFGPLDQLYSYGDGQHVYSYTDKIIQVNLDHYYRLSSVDKDGNQKFLGVRYLAPLQEALPKLVVIPGKKVRLSDPLLAVEDLTIQLYSLSGQLLYQSVNDKVDQWDFSMYPSGIYLYRINGMKQSITDKLVLMD